MLRRLLCLCALSAAVSACNQEPEEPEEGMPSPYAHALDGYWSMCVQGDEGPHPWLPADDPELIQIVDLWGDPLVAPGAASFVLTVGRLHHTDLEAAYATVRVYPLDAGIRIGPMQADDHSADDSPVLPQLLEEPPTRPFVDADRGVEGVEIAVGEIFTDPFGAIDHGILRGCEAAILRGEVVAEQPGEYELEIELIFEDPDGEVHRRVDSAYILAE